MQLEDKRFYHKDGCYEQFLKAKIATQKELEQWDKLYQYIISLHDLVVLPKGNITRLKDLRAGYLIKDGKKIRQWRTGPDFELMLEAYQLAEESIKWSIANKLNGSKDTKAINYGISIMINKLNEANQIRKTKQNQLQAQRRVDSQESKKDQGFVKHRPGRKNDERDISNFL